LDLWREGLKDKKQQLNRTEKKKVFHRSKWNMILIGKKAGRSETNKQRFV
jgi:hypothetical protein